MSRYSSLIMAVLFAFSVSSLRAEDAPKEPPKPWSNKTEASVVSTNGNSKGTTISAKNVFGYKWGDLTGLEVVGGGLGSRSGNDVTAENYNASEKMTWKLFGKNYMFERFGWDKDRFAGIRNRWDASVGLGRLLLDLPNDKLNGELGGGYINEERTEAPRDDYPAGRAYTKYVHSFTESSSFNQELEYVHDFDNSKAYRLKTESALIAAISTYLSLKTSFTWKRNGAPPPNTVRDDTLTSMALVVNY